MASAPTTFPLRQRRRVSGLAFGGMRSRRRGRGGDVAGSRFYRPGDDTRMIDRHASARLSAARGSDDFVVREHYADEAALVVTVVDGSPSMSLFPEPLPWLRKPAAARCVAELVDASAVASGCRPRPPATGERLATALERLGRTRLPSGSFVFLVSDFLDPPPPQVWRATLARNWELVPVVLQDPSWERSFPDVAGAVLPLADPATGRVRHARLTRREVAERRHANEARFAALLAQLDSFAIEPVLVDRGDPESVSEAFLAWAERRPR